MKHGLSLVRPIPHELPEELVSALGALEKAVGGRRRLMVELQKSPALTEDEGLLVRLLADPNSDDRSLAKLAAQAGFSVGGVLKFLSKARGAAALVESMDHIYRAAPIITKDLMEEATSERMECSTCNGTGRISRDYDVKPATCHDCWGKGQRVRHPDIEVRKVALQAAGILRRDRGNAISIAISQQQAMASGAIRTSASLREATDKILYGRNSRSVMEAEVVEEIEEEGNRDSKPGETE